MLTLACVCSLKFLPRPTLSRLIALGVAVSKLRSASPSLAWSCPRYAISDGDLLALTSPPPDFLFSSISLKPSSIQPHPSKPHQIKQPLSKRAVNERAVKCFCKKRWSVYLLYCKLLLYLQRGLATFRTDKGRPDIAFSGQYTIRPWTIANIGRLNNGSNVTPVFNYTYIIV